MRRLQDWRDYRKCIATIPRVTGAYTTNLYAGSEQLEDWCKSGSLHVSEKEGAVLLLRSNRDFQHVYHVAKDVSALAAALIDLPAGTYTTDLVGQGTALDELSEPYAAAGFARYAFLCRMTLTQPPIVQSENYPAVAIPEVALAKHAPEISALLERLLDRFSEPPPSLSELEQSAQAGQLLFVRRGEAVAGMLMYELRGQLAHLRLWHVDANARGEGVGRQLMAAFFARTLTARRKILWVIGDNTRSIDIYRHYGFVEDGLLDQIMLLRKESL